MCLATTQSVVAWRPSPPSVSVHAPSTSPPSPTPVTHTPLCPNPRTGAAGPGVQGGGEPGFPRLPPVSARVCGWLDSVRVRNESGVRAGGVRVCMCVFRAYGPTSHASMRSFPLPSISPQTQPHPTPHIPLTTSTPPHSKGWLSTKSSMQQLDMCLGLDQRVMRTMRYR